MKKILTICFLLLFFAAGAQEQITIKFVRPQSSQGADDRIQLSIQGNEYLIKNGGTISVNVMPDFKSSLKIDCSLPSGLQTSYFLDPKPAQNYEFEVGVKLNGLYVKLISGEEAVQDGPVQQGDGQSDSNLKINPSSGIGITAEKTNQSNSVREEWLRKGGHVRYSSAMLTGTYFRLDLSKSGLKLPSNKTSAVTGYGGGYSVSTNSINLKIPEFTTGVSKWSSFNWGIGLDVIIYGFKLPTVKTVLSPSSSMTMEMSAVSMSMRIVGNIGWTIAQGKFIDEGTWKGVALTLKYRPSFDFTYTGVTTKTTITPTNPYISNGTNTSSSGDGQLNAGGFGLDLDFTSFSAKMEKLAPKPKSKISFFVLPPVGKNPLFISLSYGITFYPRSRALKKR